MKRRDFLKGSAAIAASVPMAGWTSFTPPAEQELDPRPQQIKKLDGKVTWMIKHFDYNSQTGVCIAVGDYRHACKIEQYIAEDQWNHPKIIEAQELLIKWAKRKGHL